MKEITKAYKCDYCSRVSSNPGAMKRHEEACYRNPKNQSMCASCHFLKKREFRAVNDNEGVSHKVTEFFCAKREIHLYHPKVLRWVSYKRYPVMEDAEKMPNVIEGCEVYEQEIFPSIDIDLDLGLI